MVRSCSDLERRRHPTRFVLPPPEQLLDIAQLQFHIGRPAVVALAGVRRRLHLAQQCVHLLCLEAAAGDPADLMQVADVRYLAAWAVTACERRTTGVYDGIGPSMPLSRLLAECAEACTEVRAQRASKGIDADVSFTWVDQAFLQEQEVEPWMGPGAIPLWLPRPEYDGLPAHDVQPSLDAGLTIRPLAETTRDTLAWLEATPDAVVSGIDLAREKELLEAWHARTPG